MTARGTWGNVYLKLLSILNQGFDVVEKLLVRRVEGRDIPVVLGLVRTLAEFHDDAATITEHSLSRDALGDIPWVTLLVAEFDGQVIAYTAMSPLVQLQFAMRGMDMHHLCVAEEFRGQGVGAALITAAKEEARAQGCAYLSVGTHPDNHTAQSVYLRAGFERRDPTGPRFRILL